MSDLSALSQEALEELQQEQQAARAALKLEQREVQAELDHRALQRAVVNAGGDAAQVVRPAGIASGEAVGAPG